MGRDWRETAYNGDVEPPARARELSDAPESEWRAALMYVELVDLNGHGRNRVLRGLSDESLGAVRSYALAQPVPGGVGVDAVAFAAGRELDRRRGIDQDLGLDRFGPDDDGPEPDGTRYLGGGLHGPTSR
jgi:hypothetical protein